MVTINNLSFAYKVNQPVLQNINLNLEEGHIYGIMFCIWLVAASISSLSAFAYGSANPALSVMINSASFFSYFHMAMVLVVTTLLTTKFITPRTSTAYITLPGSSLEKFVVMLADYAFGAIAVVVLEIVCMALLGAVGSLITGNMDWWMWFAVVDNSSEMIKQVIDMKTILGVMYASPLFIAGFGAILYRQIAKKQAC